MVNLEDCIAMCGLDEAEVAALAEHEHIPEVAAASLASYLLNQDHGCEQIRDIIRDDIRESLNRGDQVHASKLLMALRHFLGEHPELKIISA